MQRLMQKSAIAAVRDDFDTIFIELYEAVATYTNGEILQETLVSQ